MTELKFIKVKTIIPVLIFLTGLIYSQTEIDRILGQIAVNNKLITAGNELMNAKKMEFNTGLAPYDPFISYSQLFGSPKDAGNQNEFSIIFSFDFPSVYSTRSSLSDLKTQQLVFEKIYLKQSILLDAKITMLELIALNRKNEVLAERYIIAGRIYEYLKIQLERGEINQMEVNKAKLQLINYKSDIELNKAEINTLNTKLTELNGGRTVIYSDTVYPDHEKLYDFETLETEIENSDPLLKKLNYDQKINAMETELQKNLRLPKIELGYRYQGLLYENFHGFQAGISIPLWERNNTVDSKELYSKYIKSLITQHKNEHYHEIKQLYEKIILYENTLKESKDLLGTIDNIKLYEKAFMFGEISSPEYLLETTYYYSIKDKIENIEKEFNILLAKLFKYKL